MVILYFLSIESFCENYGEFASAITTLILAIITVFTSTGSFHPNLLVEFDDRMKNLAHFRVINLNDNSGVFRLKRIDIKYKNYKVIRLSIPKSFKQDNIFNNDLEYFYLWHPIDSENHREVQLKIPRSVLRFFMKLGIYSHFNCNNDNFASFEFLYKDISYCLCYNMDS